MMRRKPKSDNPTLGAETLFAPSLLASIIIQLNIGSLYAWSIISSAYRSEFSFTSRDMGIVFGVLVLVFTGIMIPVGKHLHKYSPRKVVIITALLYAGGLFLAGKSNGSFLMILLGNGVLAGLGTGVGYVSSIDYGIKSVSRKSLATALITASFAIGSALSAKLFTYFIDLGYSITTILQTVAIVQGIFIALTSFLLPKSISRKEKVQSLDSTHIPIVSVICLGIGMFAATFGGLLVISNIQEITTIQNPSTSVALAIALFSGGNALGRISIGIIPIKRYQFAIIISMVSLILVLIATVFTSISFLLYLWVLLIGLLFGSFFVLFPMTVLNQFGENRFSSVYPLIFLSYGIAAAVSAPLGGYLHDIFNSAHISLFTAVAIELLGIIVLMISVNQTKK